MTAVRAAADARHAACRHAVAWRDLLELRPRDVAGELALSLPWLVASWLATANAYVLPALACSFMFFLTGLRQVHNAYHYALGLPRAATELVMLALSVLMLGSMHAIQVNHLRHHRHCMQDEDVEAASARMPAWRAVAFGPVFPLLLHATAWRVGTPTQRGWIALELAANALWVALVFGVLDVAWLRYHVLAMAVGQCLTAFFAVWTVHHDCERDGALARTLRSRFKSLLAYDMFYHLEHHLFPAVPTRRLAVLARRIDAAVPGLATHRVW